MILRYTATLSFVLDMIQSQGWFVQMMFFIFHILVCVPDDAKNSGNIMERSSTPILLDAYKYCNLTKKSVYCNTVTRFLFPLEVGIMQRWRCVQEFSWLPSYRKECWRLSVFFSRCYFSCWLPSNVLCTVQKISASLTFHTRKCLIRSRVGLVWIFTLKNNEKYIGNLGRFSSQKAAPMCLEYLWCKQCIAIPSHMLHTYHCTYIYSILVSIYYIL